MQKLENRCELLLIQHQKWMTSVTRLIVAHGMGSPHLHGYHRLTLAHFFLPEKGTIISVAPQGLYQVVNPGTPPFIPAIQEGLMTSIQTHEISHAELENWAVARKREKRELELMIDEYLLYAC
ncbi:hypothetical protein KX464_27880 [Escherichia coli]|nr:hypothetical protein [Escherichia coli]